MLVSVIIPSLNEEKNPYFYRALSSFQIFREVEVIIVDGGSSDLTKQLVTKFGYQWIESDIGASRAEKLNIGAKAAKGRTLLLHHPRSEIDPAGMSELIEGSTLKWGGFRHKFRDQHPLLKFTSWYSNEIRAKIFSIIYLDHCIFIDRALFNQISGVPEKRIFEDTLLCRRLRKVSPPTLLNYFSTTSAVRFRKNGYFYQAILNQILKFFFITGCSDEFIDRIYEKGLYLNGVSKNLKIKRK